MDKIRFCLKTLSIMEKKHNQIAKEKMKGARMSGMAESDGSKDGEGKPKGLTISKPEDQIYQKLCLCDYLRELYESAEDENEPPIEKKED